MLKFLSPIVVVLFMFYYPRLVNNIPLFGNYTETKEYTSGNVVYRPIEDFYNFSYRPWFFFIPPKSSLLFGDFSTTFYNFIQKKPSYLTSPYDEYESGGSYFGYDILVILVLVPVFGVIQKVKKRGDPTVWYHHTWIYKLYFIFVVIVLLNLPPAININNISIPTPSLLIYKIVPVFRTLTRWSVVLSLIATTIYGYFINYLLSKNNNALKRIALIVLLLTLHVALIAVKIPIIHLNKLPGKIEFIKNYSEEGYLIAGYPKGDFDLIFWLSTTNKIIVNPRGYNKGYKDIPSSQIDKRIASEEGIALLRDWGVKIVIVRKTGTATISFFDEKLRKVWEDTESAIYEVGV